MHAHEHNPQAQRRWRFCRKESDFKKVSPVTSPAYISDASHRGGSLSSLGGTVLLEVRVLMMEKDSLSWFWMIDIGISKVPSFGEVVSEFLCGRDGVRAGRIATLFNARSF